MGCEGVEGACRHWRNTKPGSCCPCCEPQVTGTTRREGGQSGEEEAQLELGQSREGSGCCPLVIWQPRSPPWVSSSMWRFLILERWFSTEGPLGHAW